MFFLPQLEEKLEGTSGCALEILSVHCKIILLVKIRTQYSLEHTAVYSVSTKVAHTRLNDKFIILSANLDVRRVYT